jgi:DNA 3'-phosphatase
VHYQFSYFLVIFTNQPGVSTARDAVVKERQFQEKLQNIMKRLGVPMNAFVALDFDHYRKPRTGMWEKAVEWLERRYSVSVQKDRSFYVGDAAGRVEGWAPGKKKDWYLHGEGNCDRNDIILGPASTGNWQSIWTSYSLRRKSSFWISP